MDLEKIGRFIAHSRKAKKLTQEQLAQQLGVTGKSVSKWENGQCLPDASHYELLCRLLDVSINELFAGEKIPEREYKTFADANLLDLLEHRLYAYGTNRLNISFETFQNALRQISEICTELAAFQTREEAVVFLEKESGADREECEKAYDFYMNLYRKDREERR